MIKNPISPKSPIHPGILLREDVLPKYGLGVTEAAVKLGVSRVQLSRVLNQRAGLSAEMCVRIEQWLGADNGGSAENWQYLQADYDLYQARLQINPESIRRPEPTLVQPH